MTETSDVVLPDRRGVHALLLCSALVIAVCGLVYELLAGTVSSYLLGDSVFQFSVVIGVFMAALGLGSYLSRFVGSHIADWFVAVQILTALLGGTSAVVLFFAFALIDNYSAFLWLLVISIGTLVGMEIPLIIRLLRTRRELKLNISDVLTADYAGALFASLLFPLVLVPQLGLIRTAAVFGLLNLTVAAISLVVLREIISASKKLWLAVVLVSALLIACIANADRAMGFFETRLFAGEVVYATNSPYQRIVVTRDGPSISLFLNGALQFNSVDEYRYHEALVHPAMAFANRRENVLILGGGDGLAVREILKYSEVNRVQLVDLDPEVTRLFSQNKLLSQLNNDALADPRVSVLNQDAWKFLEESSERFDVIFIDLPDPHDINISRLYSKTFYELIARRLSPTGVFVTQATSPLFARKAYWSIVNTIEAANVERVQFGALKATPYHVYVPSFGEWGFVLASGKNLNWPPPVNHTLGEQARELRYLNSETMSAMASFAPDMRAPEVDINTIETHVLVGYYLDGWQQWFR